MVSIQINVRRKPNKGNQEWTIQIHRQHCAQDTERKQTRKQKNYTENFNDKQHDSTIQNRGEQR